MAPPGDGSKSKLFLIAVWVMAATLFCIAVAGDIVGIVYRNGTIFIPSLLLGGFVFWQVRTRGHQKGSLGKDHITWEGDVIRMDAPPPEADAPSPAISGPSKWRRVAARCSQWGRRIRG